MSDPGMRLCSKCGIEKPVSEYHRHHSRADGLQAHCKACASEMSRAWRERNRAKNAQRHRDYHLANREKRAEAGRRSRMRPSVRLARSADSYKIRREAYGLPVYIQDVDVTDFLTGRNWGVCDSCRSTDHVEIDHIVPVRHPDSAHELSNLRLLCRTCNNQARDEKHWQCLGCGLFVDETRVVTDRFGAWCDCPRCGRTGNPRLILGQRAKTPGRSAYCKRGHERSGSNVTPRGDCRTCINELQRGRRTEADT